MVKLSPHYDILVLSNQWLNHNIRFHQIKNTLEKLSISSDDVRTDDVRNEDVRNDDVRNDEVHEDDVRNDCSYNIQYYCNIDWFIIYSFMKLKIP